MIGGHNALGLSTNFDLPLTLDLCKVQCLYLVCIFLGASIFRSWPPYDLGLGRVAPGIPSAGTMFYIHCLFCFQPLRPFIITKDLLQKQVYGLGYPGIPTMTIEEFFDKKVAEGTMHSHTYVAASFPLKLKKMSQSSFLSAKIVLLGISVTVGISVTFQRCFGWYLIRILDCMIL